MNDKIRRFICVIVPSTVCNLRCSYCYLQHRCDIKKSEFITFKVSPLEFRKALSLSRLGGTCMINFTAEGETLLQPGLIDYVRAVLEEGHYVEVVTNATITKEVQRIAAFPKALVNHLMLKCSFHYLELKTRGMLDTFFSNVRLLRDAGVSITVELMPHDELLPLREDIKALTIHEVGAPCHVTVGRDASKRDKLPLLTKLNRTEFKNAWAIFDSKLFEYKLSVFEKRQTDFCYAGDWMMVLNMLTGDVKKCYRGPKIFNVYENIEKPLCFKAIGYCCPEPHCYNAHAWLTFGCVPSESAPYYDEVRDRQYKTGGGWLSPSVKSFFHQKFSESNKEYSLLKKKYVSVSSFCYRLLRSVYRRFRG